MTIGHARVNVGTTAVELTVDPDDLRRGHRIHVQNPTGAVGPVFLGGSGVTTASYGHELTAGAAVTLDLDQGEQLFAIASAATTVNVLRSGV